MNQNEIFQSLTKLEESLKNIASANEMVQKNTDSYARLQQQVENYCKELLEIKVQLKEFCINSDEQYRNIFEEADSFHKSLLNELDSRSKAIVSDTKAIIDDFTAEANSKLSESFNSLNSGNKDLLVEVGQKFDSILALSRKTMSGISDAIENDSRLLVKRIAEDYNEQLLTLNKGIVSDLSKLKIIIDKFNEQISKTSSDATTIADKFTEIGEQVDGYILKLGAAEDKLSDDKSILKLLDKEVKNGFDEQTVLLQNLEKNYKNLNKWFKLLCFITVLLAVAIIFK